MRARSRSRGARKEQHHQRDRGDDERTLEPEIRADVVVADRQHEPDSAEQHRCRAAEPSLERHDRGQVGRAAGVAPGRLVDADRVSADRSRQDLARRVGHEIRAREPAEAVVDPLRLEQPLPAQRHRQHRADHDRDRKREPPRVRVLEGRPRLVEIDLPDEIPDGKACEGDRGADSEQAPRGHAVCRSWIRRNASRTSRMSSSEWAGESGSESTSSPARSATGSAAWPG